MAVSPSQSPERLQALSRDRLVSTAGVCGGSVRIAGTRITVWGIVAAFRQGRSVEDILEMYPAITRDDVAAALDYADSHAAEIDTELSANQDA